MIYSMTGYASKTLQLAATTIQFEIKSVNHRFLDLTIKSAEDFKPLENQLRSQISQHLSRGKIDIKIFFKDNIDALPNLKLNQGLLNEYLKLLDQINTQANSAVAFSPTELIAVPGMLIQESYSLEELQQPLVESFEQLLTEFKQSQAAEGYKLFEVLRLRLDQVQTILATTPALLAQISSSYQSKLKQRLDEVLGDLELSDNRFQQEVAFFCQKIDISEEIDRLAAHVSEFASLLTKGGIIGKRLDFICQEMHREANTFGAKSVAIETTRKSVELKVLIEQIREQVQNIM